MTVPMLLPASHRGGDHTKWSGKLSLFEQSPWTLTGVAARAAEIATLTSMFDLFHVRSDTQYGNATHPTISLNQATLESEVATFAAANYGDMKFIYHFITHTEPVIVSYSNDAHWTNITNDFAAMGAALAGEPLITGIMWDWEYYGEPGSEYWFGDNATGLSGTIADKVALVKSRFKQVMNGLLSTWPDVYLSVSHGSANSTTAAFQWFSSDGYDFAGNDVAFANRMMWAAFIGMQDAVYDAGGRAILFDGGEAYTPRTEADVWRHAAWQQVKARQNPDPGTGTHTPSMMTGFENKYQIGANVGAFNKTPYGDGRDAGLPLWGMLPESIVQENIKVFMRQTRSLAWYYTEDVDWVSRPWRPVATTAMKDAVTEGRRLGRL